MLETFEFAQAELPLLFAIFAFLFGSIVGSFLNVCIYRIPLEKSIVFPGSHCACGAKIQWFDNIPILSWCLLRGRARCCGNTFSIRYPLVEALTGACFLVAWLQHPPLTALIGFLFVSFLICASFIDLDHMIIPDRFSIGGAVIGVIISFLAPSLHGVSGPPVIANIESALIGITGMLVGAGLVYWIGVLGEVVFRKPAMGEGDVKFVGFIGAFCGWQGALFAMFGGALVGTVILLPLMLWQKLRGQPEADTVKEKPTLAADAEAHPDEWDEELTGAHVPFGPMLAIAGALYFLGLDRWVDAYFEEFITLLRGINGG